jgi:hypothetical protein
MDNNQENNMQDEQVQNPEMEEVVHENTDNLTEKEGNTDKNKKNIFSRKNILLIFVSIPLFFRQK